MPVMTQEPVKRKPMKDQDTKIPANAHREFAAMVRREYYRQAERGEATEFFGARLPAQTFVAVVLAHFLAMPEAERDEIVSSYVAEYEDIARIASGDEAEMPGASEPPLVVEVKPRPRPKRGAG